MNTVPEPNTASTVVSWIDLGKMAYQSALLVQEQQAAALLSSDVDEQVVFTVEHPPTITIGKNGTRDHIVASDEELSRLGFEVFNVDRGGDVTYHGPGQLVVYPVLHLNPWKNDVSRYVRMLEEVVLLALQEVDVEGRRLEGYPGVWVGDAKICAIGARVKRRNTGEFVTSHGLAFNVTTDLNHFQTIIPCGIVDKGVTSVRELTSDPVSYVDWQQRILHSFAEVFEVSLAEKR
ncbi:lipoyl(octanoyl) transferase LipB [Alicyclobacillus mengziensis]|uniref:Octanoyltransferase n=1 Tax=Alicyclobacillus mengziensis TaxID=2931921 RepID=A0A9X7VWB2_9BACL|nr:lipoyl(octanoyl) transferase LipB [Alicyclobacillus mengziensis]QSO45795.1 lipoyl(octanoyl) transferase LipB [Alicyclobacillus mengziensis]